MFVGLLAKENLEQIHNACRSLNNWGDRRTVEPQNRESFEKIDLPSIYRIRAMLKKERWVAEMDNLDRSMAKREMDG